MRSFLFLNGLSPPSIQSPSHSPNPTFSPLKSDTRVPPSLALSLDSLISQSRVKIRVIPISPSSLSIFLFGCTEKACYLQLHSLFSPLYSSACLSPYFSPSTVPDPQPPSPAAAAVMEAHFPFLCPDSTIPAKPAKYSTPEPSFHLLRHRRHLKTTTLSSGSLPGSTQNPHVLLQRS